ncbi:MAG: hypothetical protein ACKOYN_09925 [Planctomycetota bacterium]
MMRLLAQAADAAVPEQGVFDAHGTEVALFIAGGVVMVVVFGIAAWLFVHASREERRQREAERKERGDGA